MQVFMAGQKSSGFLRFQALMVQVTRLSQIPWKCNERNVSSTKCLRQDEMCLHDRFWPWNWHLKVLSLTSLPNGPLQCVVPSIPGYWCSVAIRIHRPIFGNGLVVYTVPGGTLWRSRLRSLLTNRRRRRDVIQSNKCLNGGFSDKCHLPPYCARSIYSIIPVV